MAEQVERQSFTNFSIEDTSEMGNRQVIDNIFEEESALVDPDEVAILDKTKTTTKETTKVPEKKKEETKKKEEEVKDESLDEFLKEEDEDDLKTKKTKTSEKPKEEEEKEQVEEKVTDSNTFAAISEELFNQGIFTKDEEEEDVEINDPQAFLERFKLEKQKGANEIVQNFLSNFGEDYQQAFQAIYVNGVDPKSYFTSYSNIEKISELDLKVEGNQELVVRQHLKDTGLNDEDVDKEIERFKNYGDLELTAQRYHKVLIKKESERLQRMEQDSQKKLQQQALIKQDYVKNVNNVLQEKLKTKEFDGIPINPKLAGEIQRYLLIDEYQTASGEKLTSFDKDIIDLKKPENHAKKVKIAILMKMLETDPTLSTIQKTAMTKQTNSLFQKLNQKEEKTNTKSKNAEKSASWFSQ